jgi:hypothetical protein
MYGGVNVRMSVCMVGLMLDECVCDWMYFSMSVCLV